MPTQCQELPSAIEARLNAELMRRHTEDGFELTYEMKRRDVDLASKVHDRRRRFTILLQQVSGAAQAPEPIMS